MIYIDWQKLTFFLPFSIKILVSSKNCSENINASLVQQLNDTSFKFSYANYSYIIFGQYENNAFDIYLQKKIIVYYCTLRRFVKTRRVATIHISIKVS